jgi:hypothetical protein
MVSPPSLLFIDQLEPLEPFPARKFLCRLFNDSDHPKIRKAMEKTHGFFRDVSSHGKISLAHGSPSISDRLAGGQAHITTCHHQYKALCPPMTHMSLNTFE